MTSGRQMSGAGGGTLGGGLGGGLGGLGSGGGAMAALLPIGALLGVKAIGVIKSIFLKGLIGKGIGGIAGIGGMGGTPGEVPILTSVPFIPPGVVGNAAGPLRRRSSPLSSN